MLDKKDKDIISRSYSFNVGKILSSVSKLSYLRKGLLALGVIAFVLIIEALLPFNAQKASAAGVSFQLKWKTSTSITVSGSLQGTLTATPANYQSLTGTVSGGPDSCTDLQVFVNSANTAGSVGPYNTPPSGGPASASGGHLCYGVDFGSQSDVSNIPISGTRPTIVLPTKQATVVVLNVSQLVYDVAPNNITFTFHQGNSTGNVVDTVNASVQDQSPGGIYPSNNVYISEAALSYSNKSIDLASGSYTVCFSQLSNCQSFTISTISASTLTETFSAGTVVPVEINDNDIVLNATTTLGPITLVLQPIVDETVGSTVQTVETDTATVNPSAAVDTAAQGGAVVTGTTTVIGGFVNVSPGTYQVCVSSGSANTDTTGTGTADTNATGTGTASTATTSDCTVVSVAANGTVNPDPVVIQDNSPPNSGSGQSALTCQSTGGPLSWFTCSVIDAINTAEQHLESLVKGLLKTGPIDFSTNDCNTQSQSYTACVSSVWSDFRDIGDVLLIIALLAVIFAESMGGGLIDAYTAKKMIPRILIAAILINLSLYLVAGLEDITNILGQGIFTLLTEPFKATGTYKINISGTGGNLFGGAALGTAGLLAFAFHEMLKDGKGAALGDALSMLFLFVGLPVLLAIIGVLLTIFFRSTILILLLMTSPIAFALYCLPNTEQYFRKWWDLLFKTLMVYPIVMIAFAMCDLGAVVVTSFAPSSEQWLGDLMAVVGVAAPLFLIPFAFRIAGGAIGGLHGAITNFRGKAVEGIKGNVNDPNSLRNRTKRRFATRRAASGLSNAAIATRLNPRQLTARGRQNARTTLSAHRQAGLEQLRRQEEETGLFRSAQGDSNIMRELAWYSNGREAHQAADTWRMGELASIGSQVAAGTMTAAAAVGARQEVERKYGNRNAAIAVASRIGYNGATRRAAFLNQYHVGFEMEEGEKGWDHAMKIADSISGGDEFQFRSLQDEYQAVAKGPAGRVDQAGNTDGTRAYNGNKAWNNGSLYEIGMGKGRSIDGSAKYYKDVLSRVEANAPDQGKDADFIKEAADRGMDWRDVAAESVGAFYSEQIQLGRSAKGAARDSALAARRQVGDAMQGSTYVKNILSKKTTVIPGTPGATATTPASVADTFAQTREVGLRARTYETPESIARQQGQVGP